MRFHQILIAAVSLFLFQGELSFATSRPDLPNRSCRRVWNPADIAKAKYLVCFNQGVLSELDFSNAPITGNEFARVSLKIKSCHAQKPPLQRVYQEVNKSIRPNGTWAFSLKKINERFSNTAFRNDDFFFDQDAVSGMDSSSRIDSIGSGWCRWLEKPLGQQPADENCVNALACSPLWPEYCNCTWE